MLKKKVRVKVGRVPPKQSKSQPQWDELEQWCQQTTAKLNTITKGVAMILAQGQPCKNVSPELEKAINAVSTQAIKIDRQVPDSPNRK